MKSIVIEITPAVANQLPLRSSISFQKFANDIERLMPQQSVLRKTFFESIVTNFRQAPGFLDNFSLNAVETFSDQLALVMELIRPSMDSGSILSAICAPLSSMIFYGTDNFYSLVTEKTTGKLRCEIVKEHDCIARHQLEAVYSLILEQLYDLHLPKSKSLIITMTDKSGIRKFYSIDSNPSYIKVLASGDLPELNLERISEQFRKSQDLNDLNRLLPLSLFHFEGFSFLTLSDVTDEHAIENLKSIIMNQSGPSSDSYHGRIIDCLKMLCQDDGIDFALMPFISINDSLIFNENSIFRSKLVNDSSIVDVNEQNYVLLATANYKSPQMHQDIGMAYALLPAYCGEKIIGVLEVYSLKRDVIEETILARLDRALPMIAQVFINYLKEFEGHIDQVIRQKFTSLQPAVQWRFKEAASNFLKNRLTDSNIAVMEDIRFKNVFPLYGSIDIRNSTIERNAAIQQDFREQFDFLIGIFNRVKLTMKLELAGEVAFKCEQMLAQVIQAPEDSDEVRVKEFLDMEVHPLLRHLQAYHGLEGLPVIISKSRPIAGLDEADLAKVIEDYLVEASSQTGKFCLNRRSLENSIQIITSAVGRLVDSFEQDIQRGYPIYFEKFRSDGIEYDIYAGQTVTPHQTFDKFYLENIRLKQLISMAAISKSTHDLSPALAKRLETTQLIFIYSGSIDISFRDDERRFNVEGAYNVRYQVIKKRIDKVHIKGTAERLTQPGKIALVYFTSKSIEEYVAYIRYLQQQSILLDDLEFLDLEELQGVSGLRALRVGVCFEG